MSKLLGGSVTTLPSASVVFCSWSSFERLIWGLFRSQNRHDSALMSFLKFFDVYILNMSSVSRNCSLFICSPCTWNTWTNIRVDSPTNFVLVLLPLYSPLLLLLFAPLVPLMLLLFLLIVLLLLNVAVDFGVVGSGPSVMLGFYFDSQITLHRHFRD